MFFYPPQASLKNSQETGIAAPLTLANPSLHPALQVPSSGPVHATPYHNPHPNPTMGQKNGPGRAVGPVSTNTLREGKGSGSRAGGGAGGGGGKDDGRGRVAASVGVIRDLQSAHFG